MACLAGSKVNIQHLIPYTEQRWSKNFLYMAFPKSICSIFLLIFYAYSFDDFSNNVIFDFLFKFQVLVEVLQKLNWHFVTVVYTDDIGGMHSFMELRERVTGKGICLTAGVAMSSTDTREATMKKVLGQIKAKGTTGVIYLGMGSVLQSLFKVAENYPGATDLQWIVTSSLSLSNTFPNNK